MLLPPPPRRGRSGLRLHRPGPLRPVAALACSGRFGLAATWFFRSTYVRTYDRNQYVRTYVARTYLPLTFSYAAGAQALYACSRKSAEQDETIGVGTYVRR